ncbi:MAG: 4-hydroxy-tetrahydrodipicolinate reductase [Clostridiales Family XIII bacterium]|jgi:4-hydroxy-tetrahydrodipicolinate reductase|nr:4-hydroxy-tetrahydrodipicolinate reductase [Clostridiales Family XIII bacterium]
MDFLIHGINGRMGRQVLDVLAGEPDANVPAGFDKMAAPEPPVFRGVAVPVYENPADYAGGGDVIIDFSNFTAVPGLLAYAVAAGIPAVICTTALGEGERSALREAARSIPVFNSANMSLGINLVARMSAASVPALEENFNVEIIEKHHNQKADSPSGTALLIADAINEKCAVKKNYIYGRHGKDDVCLLSDMGIHAVRGGSLPGQHTVLFAGPDETIEITHTVYSRKVFALGAVKAARYLAGKAPGLYNMDDLLG